MIKGQETFNFIDKRVGVTKDGVKYICINVISRENQSVSFISTDEKLISKIGGLSLTRFAPIKLTFDISKEFNQKTRYSNWVVTLIGVD